MGYKVLGFAVWHGGKWYLRRRLRGVRRKAAIAGRKAAIACLAALLIAGAVAAQREAGEH
jgi:hypothetical protein